MLSGQYKFTVIIQGNMNSGKSTLLNAILGQMLLPSSSTSETHDYFFITHDKNLVKP